MDRVVQRWFELNAPDVPLRLDRLGPDSYERYLAQLHLCAKELSQDGEVLQDDDVEYLIYTSGAAVEGSADPTGLPGEVAAQFSAGELLERLEAALGVAGSSEKSAPHLQALYRIISEQDER